jgi:hypothetical protein
MTSWQPSWPQGIPPSSCNFSPTATASARMLALVYGQLSHEKRFMVTKPMLKSERWKPSRYFWEFAGQKKPLAENFLLCDLQLVIASSDFCRPCHSVCFSQRSQGNVLISLSSPPHNPSCSKQRPLQVSKKASYKAFAVSRPKAHR